MKKTQEKKLDVAEMRVLRSIVLDRIGNERIRSTAKGRNIQEML